MERRAAGTQWVHAGAEAQRVAPLTVIRLGRRSHALSLMRHGSPSNDSVFGSAQHAKYSTVNGQHTLLVMLRSVMNNESSRSLSSDWIQANLY